MRPFKEMRQWPRRVFFAGILGYAYLAYGRPFSLLLITVVLVALEIIFTRIDENRKVLNEFFSHYELYKRKEK